MVIIFLFVAYVGKGYDDINFFLFNKLINGVLSGLDFRKEGQALVRGCDNPGAQGCNADNSNAETFKILYKVLVPSKEFSIRSFDI